MPLQLKFAQALNRIAQAIISHDKPAPILNVIVSLVGETLKADHALIYEVSFDDQQAVRLCEWVNPSHPETPHSKAAYPLALFKSSVNEVRHSHQALISHADNINLLFANDGAGDLLHRQMKIRSLLWYPFGFRENAFYFLALNQLHSHREWTVAELAFLDSVAQLVGVALNKIRLMEDRSQLKHSLQNATEATLRMKNSLQRITQAVDQSSNVIVITDLDARIEYVNNAFSRTTGYTFEEIKGRNPRLLSSGQTSRATYDHMWKHLTEGKDWEGEITNRRKDGSDYINRSRITPVRDAYGKISHYLAIAEDITDKKRDEERIRYLAHFDELTGLPNRTQLRQHFEQALSAAKRSNGFLTLMIFDLDHFKDINDTLGHSMGDALLVELSKRIHSLMLNNESLVRLGGDEFMLMLPGIEARAAEQMARRLLEAITQPFHVEQQKLHVTGSIGIAVYPDDGLDIETLSKHTDAAMYRAKKEGRHTYRFFTQEMQKTATRTQKLLNALRHALEENQFTLNYQPQLDIQSGQVVGAEALLRWHHPELGNVSPAEFIPIAEASGLIVAIGEWVLRSAVQQAKNWLDAGHPPLIMAVNLSAVQFRQPNLPDLITRILDEVGLPPEYLELELTEGVALNDPQGAITIMNNLHQRGIRMSIDDFGTGYSSLSYLKKFKVYKLKIDQSFVRDISTDAEDKAIVSAIINMAHSLGLQTIAEGVETAAQLAFLQSQGCHEVQGYYYSKPLPCDQFDAFLRNRK